MREIEQTRRPDPAAGLLAATDFISAVHKYAKLASTKQKLKDAVELIYESAENELEYMAILLTLGEVTREVLDEKMQEMMGDCDNGEDVNNGSERTLR